MVSSRQIRNAFTVEQYGATLMKTGWHAKVWNEDFFKVLDVAARVGSGVGSFGVGRYYVLLAGHDEDIADEVSSRRMHFSPMWHPD